MYRAVLWSRVRTRSRTFAVSLLAFGCAAPQPGLEAERALDARPFVVGAALLSLDAAGQFVTETPPPLPYPTITPAQAREQAVALVRLFGPSQQDYLERDGRARIDFSSLVAGRTYYAWSAYQQTLPADFHPGFRRSAGPYYLVTLLNQDVAVLSVAVSVYNTDVGVTNGRITNMGTNGRMGAEFHMEGLKPSKPFISPERAAQIASEFAGVRVASAPRYEMTRIRKGMPQLARWHVRLERAVRVRDEAGGQEHEIDELVIDQDGRPTRAVPATTPVVPDRYFESHSGEWVEFRPRASLADSLVRVIRVGRN